MECKVEDHIYQIPDSPSSWANTNSTSPVDAHFTNSIYNVSGNNGSYHGRANGTDRWGLPSDSAALNRSDLGWGASHGHLARRRDSQSIIQDTWPSIHSQSNRWQDSTISVTANGGASYPDRSRVRPGHPYDHGGRDQEVRRDSHRLGWQNRDGSHSSRERRSPHSSFTPSPTLPFTPQGYHTTPSYTSAWTPSENNLMTTPTLHPISNGSGYDSYASTGTSLAGTDDFGSSGVEDFAQES